MTAQELLKQDRLPEALESLQGDIRRQPGDAGLRFDLFQLLAIRGQWERALSQVQTAVSLAPRFAPLAMLLRSLVELEQVRHAVMTGLREPEIFGPTPRWLGELLKARWTGNQDRATAAVRAHAAALEQAPVRPGSIDGRPFSWISDADARFGPLIELYLQGHYYWAPMECIGRIELTPPRDLQDLVWLQAKVTWINGGTVLGHIPSRYPGTEASADAQLQMARSVGWRELGPGCYIGTGVRVFSTDDGDHPLTKTRVIEFAYQD